MRLRRGVVAALTPLLLGLTAPAHGAALSSAGSPHPTTCSAAVLTAHRGLVDDRHTENTRRSLRFAARSGADAVEFDIRMTRDGHWILMHDTSIDRTTNGTGSVRDLGVDQVLSYATDDSAVTGHTNRVPTLRRALSAMERRYPGSLYQIEIKRQAVTVTDVARALRVITGTVGRDRLLITSFSFRVLHKVHQADPAVIRGYIANGYVPTQIDGVANRQIQYIGLPYPSMNSSLVADLHARGIRVTLRGANEPTGWTEVVNMGADNVVVDNLPGYVAWCGGSPARSRPTGW